MTYSVTHQGDLLRPIFGKVCTFIDQEHLIYRTSKKERRIIYAPPFFINITVPNFYPVILQL